MGKRIIEPPIVRRIARRAILFCIIWHALLWVALLVTWWIASRYQIVLYDLKIIRPILIVHFGVLVVCLVAYAHQYRRYRRRAIDEAYTICTHCAYPLKGLPAAHRCPECGNAYELSEAQGIWRAWLHETDFRVS